MLFILAEGMCSLSLVEGLRSTFFVSTEVLADASTSVSFILSSLVSAATSFLF